MARESDEVASRGRKQICKLLRRLGVIQEGSETSSAGTSVVAAQAPRAGTTKGDRDLIFMKKIGGEDLRQQGRSGPGIRRDEEQASPGGELATLLRDLGGAQANDAGWLLFIRNYVEYPTSGGSGRPTGGLTMLT